MRIELGTRIWTSDGQEAGTIDAVILDPGSGDVKAVVLRKGALLPRDVEVSIMALQEQPEGGLRLAYTADQLEALPPFLESNYTAMSPTGYLPPTVGYPGLAVYWPVGYGMAVPPYPVTAAVDPQQERQLRQQDLENAVIREGSEIRGRDGEKVGELDRLIFDSSSGHLARFTVSKGLLFPDKATLPASLIAGLDDGVIYLSVRADEVPLDETG